MAKLDKLRINQASRRFKELRESYAQAQIKDGWIHYVRQALGISQQKLAERSGLSKSTVSQAESREKKGQLTLETLRKLAAAMECDFVYAIVPKADPMDILKKQAASKAQSRLHRADTHMTLEDQRVNTQYQGRVELLAAELLEKGKVW